jgi:hypothetical protein
LVYAFRDDADEIQQEGILLFCKVFKDKIRLVGWRFPVISSLRKEGVVDRLFQPAPGFDGIS